MVGTGYGKKDYFVPSCGILDRLLGNIQTIAFHPPTLLAEGLFQPPGVIAFTATGIQESDGSVRWQLPKHNLIELVRKPLVVAFIEDVLTALEHFPTVPWVAPAGVLGQEEVDMALAGNVVGMPQVAAIMFLLPGQGVIAERALEKGMLIHKITCFTNL